MSIDRIYLTVKLSIISCKDKGSKSYKLSDPLFVKNFNLYYQLSFNVELASTINQDKSKYYRNDSNNCSNPEYHQSTG